MQLTVKNSTGSTGNFKIALGSNGNHFYPIINKNGASYYRTSDSGARKFSDVMVINNLSAYPGFLFELVTSKVGAYI